MERKLEKWKENREIKSGSCCLMVRQAIVKESCE